MKALAQLFPDIPRWVETRAMLLSARAELFGLREDASGCHFVALDRRGELVCVVGRPSPDQIAEAVSHLEDGAVLTPADDPFELPGWEREMAILHEQTSPRSFAPGPNVSAGWLDIRDLPLATPDELRKELLYVASHSQIAATFVRGKPVSFCCAIVTETLWDVGIDTLEDYRGKGYAMHCFEWMRRAQAEQGRRPVWGSLVSNTASLRLARKLGFSPVDEIAVYERP